MSSIKADNARSNLTVGEVRQLQNQVAKLEAQINTPEVLNFTKAVNLEAAHQKERWSPEHDAQKTPFDWFWLIGYLSQKAASAAVAGDNEKAMHHTITTAAALANWHLSLTTDNEKTKAKKNHLPMVAEKNL